MLNANVEIQVPVGLAEATARLEALPRFAWFPKVKRQVVASVSGNRITAHVQRRSVQNSFQPCFRGRLEQTSVGTVLRGRLGMHPVVISFMAVWFGLAVLLGVLGTAAGDLGGLFMAAFGVALVGLGRWGAKNDADVIEAQLRRALEESAAP